MKKGKKIKSAQQNNQSEKKDISTTTQVSTTTLGLIVLFFTFFFYITTTAFSFTLDDKLRVVFNPLIKNQEGIVNIFKSPTKPGDLYRPLATTVSYLTYKYKKLNASAYHLVSVLLHSLCSFLVFITLLKVTNRKTSFLGSLIFCIHPIHTEAIANISYQSELLACLFGLSTILLSIKIASKENFSLFLTIICIIFFFFALSSKESAALFLPLTALTLYWNSKANFKISNCIKILSPFLIALIAYFTLRFFALGHSITGDVQTVTMIDNPLKYQDSRILSAFVLLGLYLKLMFLPLNLSPDYSFNQLGGLLELPNTEAIAYLALVIIILALAVSLLLNKSVVAFGSLWFFISFIITSNVLFPIGTIFGERLAYIPSIGICLLIAEIISKISNKLFYLIFSISILSLLTLRTYQELPNWHDSLSLYQNAITTSPNSAKMHNNYAALLFKSKQFPLSEKHYRRALEIYPEYDSSHYGLGKIYLVKGNQEKALEYFEKATICNPKHISSLNYLGRLKLQKGDFIESEKAFNQILAEDPNNINGLLGLLAINIRKQRIEPAKELIKKIEKLDNKNMEFNRLKGELSKLAN